jgi:hypothetical protein
MDILGMLGLNKGIGGFGPGAVDPSGNSGVIDPLGIIDPFTRKLTSLPLDLLGINLSSMFSGGGGGGGGGVAPLPPAPRGAPFTYDPTIAGGTGTRGRL